MRQATRGFEAAGESVRAAREFVASTVGDWRADDLEWPLVQLVSELACNAVIHARTPFTVTLSEIDGGCRLGVTDSSPRSPQPRAYGVEATTGRGLRLVEQMSRGWGVETAPDGKTVWVEIDSVMVDDDLDLDELMNVFDIDDDLAPPALDPTPFEEATERAAGPEVHLRGLALV